MFLQKYISKKIIKYRFILFKRHNEDEIFI